MDAETSRLINDLIEQQLDDSRVAELSSRLARDPAAASEFFKLLRVHQELAQKIAPVREFSADELATIKAVDDRLGRLLGPETEGVTRTSTQAPRTPKRTHWRARLWGVGLAIAASAVAALAIWSNWDASGRPQVVQNAPPAAPRPAADGIVAHVIQKIDCDWEDDRWSVSTSASIVAGQQINISRGLLTLKFSSGAEVTLNGPACFIANTDMSAQLVSGSLSAHVPPEGRGFTIETHAGDFVDLGTEFGMIVSKEGAVETHVFDGEVVAEPVNLRDDENRSFVLSKGAAWARRALGGGDESLAAQPSRFMRPMMDDTGQTPPPPPVEEALALWFDASAQAMRDDKNAVYAWGNQAPHAGGKAADAWQVVAAKRPGWQPRAIGSRPALRFDGYMGLVTEPIKLGVAHTSAVVFRVDGDAAERLVNKRAQYQHLGVQLLNLNGPPHTVLQVNADRLLESRVHLGFLKDRREPVDVGFLRTGSPIDDEEAHVVLYSYDGHRSVARLHLDGALVAQSANAPAVGASMSPRYLGSHYDRRGFGFTGDIAEFLVYSKALSTDEARDLSRWLADKYGIEPRPEDEAAGASTSQ